MFVYTPARKFYGSIYTQKFDVLFSVFSHVSLYFFFELKPTLQNYLLRSNWFPILRNVTVITIIIDLDFEKVQTLPAFKSNLRQQKKLIMHAAADNI